MASLHKPVENTLNASSQYDTREQALRCIGIFCDQTQERNTEEYKDRIRVDPCIFIALR